MSRSATGDDGRTSADSFLITRAESSLEQQHRDRMRRYLLMMSIRIPALVIASLVYVWTQNGWWALAIIAVSIPIPWIAVLVANDRPARKRGEVPQYLHGAGPTVEQPQIPLEPDAPPPAAPRIIDAEPVDGSETATHDADRRR
ncbi:MAG: DUF3099 domain-containing protein [Gordonia sp. (in: high G+C Gram-positive bacteria)]